MIGPSRKYKVQYKQLVTIMQCTFQQLEPEPEDRTQKQPVQGSDVHCPLTQSGSASVYHLTSHDTLMPAMWDTSQPH